MRRLLLSLLLVGSLSALTAQASVVKTLRDDQGWKLQVDGQDMAVKGVVWSYTPAGEDYTYDLWSQPEDFITRVIDTDMTLMKHMGVNAIRVFSTVPPRWVEYIYDRYGIYTMVNDLFGRYGVTVDGRWQFPTDYSNPATRRTLLAQAKKTFETFKDTRGVLMYMLGNESNYGLEWTSTTIQNLPGGERADFKAKALYSLFEEALALGKTIDANRPMGLVNGDLQYLRVMRQMVPDLDILGVNTYRGPKSYDAFYNSIAKDLDRPFVYTELGADCFNAATEQEDQLDQAELIESQWKEIYEQAYGKGKAANCLGGYIFEWMDEWWKNGPSAGLSVHSTEGTWNNGAYAFDAVPGKNNMNEEWFGIVAQSRKTDGGIARRVPRMAYFLLKDLWFLDMYTSTRDSLSQAFSDLDRNRAQLQGMDRASGDGTTDPLPSLELHGSVTARSYFKGDNEGWAGKVPSVSSDPSLSSDPIEAFQTTTKLGATIRAAEGLTGSLMLRLLPPQVANDPAVDLSDPAESAAELVGTSGNTRTPIRQFELYQATVDYRSSALDATLHYHDGHADWANEGDFFGLLPETFDMLNTDKADSKAPFGLEMTLPGLVPGLKVYAGPEIYWGANPSVMAKYSRAFGPVGLTLIHDEEVGTYMNLAANANPDADVGVTDAQKTADRWTSLDADAQVPGLLHIEAGFLLGRYDRIDDPKYTYERVDSQTITTGLTFTLADALGGKIRLTSDAIPYLHAMVQYLYAGPLADTRPGVPRDGSQLYDSGSGNRSELKASVTGSYGDFSLTTTGLYRVPLVDALWQANLGVAPRNPLVDSFTVWDNRKALQGEMVLTWNPTGATYFYDWNNPDREAAPLAAGLGLLYDFDLGPTDASTFFDAANNLYAFSAGLPEVQGTWSLQARVTGRPLPGLRVNVTGQFADQQATGIDSAGGVPVVQFWEAKGQVAWDRLLFEGSYAYDAWGPYDWDRQFGINYPAQWSLGVAYGLKPISFLTDGDRIGIRFSERTFGSQTPVTESQGLSYRIAAELYAGWSF